MLGKSELKAKRLRKVGMKGAAQIPRFLCDRAMKLWVVCCCCDASEANIELYGETESSGREPKEAFLPVWDRNRD